VPVEDGRLVMGTTLDVALLVPASARERAARQVERALASAESLEATASRWRPDSDTSELNRRAGQGGMRVDPRLYALLVRAEEGRRISGGVFDVTVGPLLALWATAEARGVPPDAADLAAARDIVGLPLRIGADGGVSLPRAGMSLDLGGIAKGYALDEIAAALRDVGLARGLLSFGQSSVWALGAPADAPRWRLAVRDDDGRGLGVVELSDEALSVSSSWGQAREIAGRRYGHVVDPRSGLPVSRGRQALVVARDATLAEVLSTALLVLPEDEGRRMLREQGAEARVVDESGSEWQTPGWREHAP